MTLRIRALAFACVSVAASVPVAAQKGSAMVYGAVVNRSTQGPIANAVITHAGDGRVVHSDSLGYYQFHDLKAGLVKFTIRAPGFPLSSVTVALTNGERMERDIELDTSFVDEPPAGASPDPKAQPLPTVAVEAPAGMGRRFADFERRKQIGRGHYITKTDLERKGATNLIDAVRDLRGVNVDCGGGGGCFIRMARAPMRCLPEYIIDERVDPFFAPGVAVRDIEAIEVYLGPADVPGEFAGVNAGCGVVVIWTKSGPPRRKPT